MKLTADISSAIKSGQIQKLSTGQSGSDDLKPGLALNAIQLNLSRVMGSAIAGLVMVEYGFL